MNSRYEPNETKTGKPLIKMKEQNMQTYVVADDFKNRLLRNFEPKTNDGYALICKKANPTRRVYDQLFNDVIRTLWRQYEFCLIYLVGLFLW